MEKNTAYILPSKHGYLEVNKNILYHDHFNLIKSISLCPWTLEKNKIPEALRSLITINNLITSTKQSHKSAIDTLINVKDNKNEGYILYLRDFSLGGEHRTITSIKEAYDPQTHKPLETYAPENKVIFSPEYADHVILKEIKNHISKPIIGLYNDHYLQIYKHFAINNKRKGFDSFVNNLDLAYKTQKSNTPLFDMIGDDYNNMLRTQEDSWKDTVTTLIKSADSIILYVSGPSDGTLWEKEEIKKLNKQEQTLVIFGEDVFQRPRLQSYVEIEKEFPDFWNILNITNHYEKNTSNLDELLSKPLADLQLFKNKYKFLCEESFQRIINHPHFINTRPCYIIPGPSNETQLIITKDIENIFDQHYSKFLASAYSIAEGTTDISDLKDVDALKILQCMFEVYSTAAIIEDSSSLLFSSIAIKKLIDSCFSGYGSNSLNDSVATLANTLPPDEELKRMRFFTYR